MAFSSALIGCGRIGFLLEDDALRNKPCTHFGGAAAAGIGIRFASDIDGRRLEEFAIRSGIPTACTFTDAGTLLHEARPELVIISTWTETHEEIGITAAKNGARVIVIEKPVVSSLSGAKKLLSACRRSGAVLVVNHERRYDARYLAARRAIQEGRLGAVRTVRASVLTGPYRGASRPASGGGPLLHDGTHMIDMMRFLFGDIVRVRGEFRRDSRRRGYEDRALAWLKTDRDVDIFLEAGGSRGYFEFELDVSGSEGRLVIGNGYEKYYHAEQSRLYTGFRDLAEHPFPRFEKNNCFEALYREVRALFGKKAPEPVSAGLDGYKALEAVHAIYLSAAEHREIRLPLSPKSIDLKKIFRL